MLLKKGDTNSTTMTLRIDLQMDQRGIAFKFKDPKGIITEVQVLQPEMLRMKDMMHEVYNLQKSFKKSPVPVQKAIESLEDIMTKNYNDAYAIDNSLDADFIRPTEAEFIKKTQKAQTPDKSLSEYTEKELKSFDINLLKDGGGGFLLKPVNSVAVVMVKGVRSD